MSDGYRCSVERQRASGMSGTAFPFDDDSSLPDGLSDVIVDACACVQSGDGATPRVRLCCAYVGEDVVAAAFSVDGIGSMSACVSRRSLVPFLPVPMVSTTPFLSGAVTFGHVGFGRPRRLVGSPWPALSETVVLRPRPGRLREFVQPSRSASVSGLVGIETQDGVYAKIVPHGDDSDGSDMVTFDCSKDVLESITLKCDVDWTEYKGLPPIKSINGVSPDSFGRIAIVFAGSEWGGNSGEAAEGEP